ncbi:response regulator, partial [Ideonella sp.]|uniref:response regulator n=1 Tax=Ideonella sp. TaxID=1929293 RepID=UPI0035B152A0
DAPPRRLPAPRPVEIEPPADPLAGVTPVLFANPADDDRNDMSATDRVLLIVENDVPFAKVLLEAARLAGFKGLVTGSGAAALTLAREYRLSAVTLDIHLPDMAGWRVLDRLKTDPATRHVPVCVVSTDDARERALQAGAIGFLPKPLQSADVARDAVEELGRYADRATRRLVVAMPPGPARVALLDGLDADVQAVLVDDAALGRELMASADALVVDATVAELGPEDVLDAVSSRGGVCQLPVVVYQPEGAPEAAAWSRGRDGFGVSVARSEPALRRQVAYWLHRAAEWAGGEGSAEGDAGFPPDALKGRKALIVDDDMRNIFALATVLDEVGMVIVSADNGREAIRLVEVDPSIDVVLMDIMMPEMDGIETMQRIRQLPRGRELPMVAVTAKAMKGDRQKCIEAGAWDYLSKPVDPSHLLTVLRGWLCGGLRG